MTPEEEAAWEADRKMQKEFDIANAAERDRRIKGIFLTVTDFGGGS
jgi:hypothetical protein